MQTKTTRQLKKTTKTQRTKKIVSSKHDVQNIQSNNSSGKPLLDSYSINRSQTPCRNNQITRSVSRRITLFCGRSPDRRKSQVIHKTDLADQIVKKISIETITLDQNQVEAIIQTIRGTVLTQTLEKILLQ